MTTILHFVSSKDIADALPQNAEIRIRIPADAIIATTAGRREPSTPRRAPYSGISNTILQSP